MFISENEKFALARKIVYLEESNKCKAEAIERLKEEQKLLHRIVWELAKLLGCEVQYVQGSAPHYTVVKKTITT